MKNAVIYARYSSKKQTEQSIEGQIHACEQYAKAHDIKIIKHYIDRAVSGRSDNREQFQQMLEDSKLTNFQYVLVYKLDRFARNRYDSAIHKATLKKYGIKVLSAMENLEDNPESVLLESLLEGLAEYYSLELAQKLARGRAESISKGQYVGGFVPFGFYIKDKKYFIKETEAKIVRLIFELFNAGNSKQQIINHLNNQKIFNRKDKPFGFHQLDNILKNEIYIGNLISGELRNNSCLPQIIEKEQFEMAQLNLEQNYICRPNTEQDFKLSGKLYCGKCGELMNGDSTVKQTKTYFYYSCSGARKKKLCDLKSIRKEKLEKQVKDIVTDYLKEERINEISNNIFILLKDDTEYIAETKNIMDEIHSINIKLSNLTNAIKNGIINEQIKKENDTLLNLLDEKKRVLNLMKNIPLVSVTPEKVKSFLLRILSSKNQDVESLIFNILIKKVILYPNKLQIILNLTDPTSSTHKDQIIEKDLKNSSAELPLRLPKSNKPLTDS